MEAEILQVFPEDVVGSRTSAGAGTRTGGNGEDNKGGGE